MGQVSIWIRNLIFILLISSFVELIMPNSTYRKYCKVILGLMVITIMIKPISVWSNTEQIFDKSLFETSNNIERMNILDNSEEISDIQKKLVIDEYHKGVEEKIQNDLRSNFENYDIKVTVNIDKNINSTGFGSIRGINVRLQKKDTGIVKKIKRVEINNKDKEKELKDEKKDLELKKDVNKIEERINVVYGIPKENINISFN